MDKVVSLTSWNESKSRIDSKSSLKKYFKVLNLGQLVSEAHGLAEELEQSCMQKNKELLIRSELIIQELCSRACPTSPVQSLAIAQEFNSTIDSLRRL